jgi:hypothetical protein
VSEQPQEDGAQDWPKDRIRVKMAQTYTWLGQPEKAAELEAGVVDSEAGKVDAVRAQRASADDYARLIEQLDAVIAKGGFEPSYNALGVYAQLYDRNFADAARRAQTKEKIRVAWSKLGPCSSGSRRFRSSPASRSRTRTAPRRWRSCRKRASSAAGARWTPEAQVAGDGAARRPAPSARARASRRAPSSTPRWRFSTRSARGSRTSTAQARCVRSPRPAQGVGDESGALKLYARAVEAGVENPNSRPRAEDLAATCRSMAVHEVEPDAALRARMKQIRAALGDPW